MPRPTAPYITFHLSTINSVGVDWLSGASNAGLIQIIGNRDFTLEVQAIGLSSMDYLEKLKISLEYPTIQFSLRQAGVVFVDRLFISDISEVVDNRWEERNAMDLKFRFAQMDSDTPGMFEHVDLEKDFFALGGNTITVENITIP
jgi:hypothetical protein